MTQNQKKLLNLLKDMFQFDQADLDFGIYRIMSIKRAEITAFLETDLPQTITENLAELKNTDTQKELDELNKQIETTKKSTINDAVKQAALAELETQKKKITVSDISAVEIELYNHLTAFFARYYSEGDFISQRRYKDGAYAIPYEGEEVKLHWANADQYYVKTTEYFNDYTFITPLGKTVHFKIVTAQIEKDNNKASTKRTFQLHTTKPFEVVETEPQKKELFIYIEYTTDTQTQTDRTQEIITTFGSVCVNTYPDFIELQDKKDGTTLLQKHLKRYTAKNTFDYFIHKDLKKFLERELDFYIKNEVVFLDDLETQNSQKIKEQIIKAKVLRTIGKKIIAFLAQLEDFQKKLFLKKKFVTQTQYCITLDKIAERFYAEIVTNKAQHDQWVQLFAIDELIPNGDFFGKTPYSNPLTVDFLKEHPFLVLDTAFFSTDFTEQLLDSIDNLDNSLDGLLIKSENLQALNLLQEKYREQVKCVYIDPPYNTNASEILYKNGYKHSSWLSLMQNRMTLGKSLLSIVNEGVQIVAIDDTEMVVLSQIISSLFSNYEITPVIINHHPAGAGLEGTNISQTHEYAIFITPTNKKVLNGVQKNSDINEIGFMRTGTAESNLRIGRPNSFYSILVDKKTSKIMGLEKPPKTEFPLEDTDEGWSRIYPMSSDGTERVWRRSYESALNEITLGNVFCRNGKNIILKSSNDGKFKPIFSNWTDTKYNAGVHGTNTLKNILGDNIFSYPKSIYNVFDCISAVTNSDDDSLILDYFAGSGTTAHAVINLNREDGGCRKYILCEMGEYFDTVTKPRIQKVIYSADWKDGKPTTRKGSSHAFKYITLESYEDTLNNIAFANIQTAELATQVKQEYVLSYMLCSETAASVCLANADLFANPFNYSMNITRKGQTKPQNIDVIETFNYLIGLTVERSYATQNFSAVFTTGTHEVVTATINTNTMLQNPNYKLKMLEGTTRTGEKTLILWRQLTGDTIKDNAVLDAFFAKKHINPTDFEYDRIYVNGDNNIENLRSENETWKVVLIEHVIKDKMFEGV